MEELLKINCHSCGAKIDVTGEEAFKQVNCPACNIQFYVPKRFDHFLLEEILGENNISTVYRAIDLTLSREVCLKVLSKKICSNKEKVAKALNQAGKVAIINHSNIIPIFSCGENDDGMTFIIMQYMGASSLEDHLDTAKGKLPLVSVYRCIRDAAKGLQHALEQGVLHHDVQPANILIDTDGNVKLSDFGLAEILYDNNKDVNLYYMSPERAAGDPNDSSGDIYSLGATFYHIATGILPFQGKTENAIRESRLNNEAIAPHKLRSEIPEHISLYILKMLSKNKENRPTSFTEVAKKVDMWMKEINGTTGPVPKQKMTLHAKKSGNNGIEKQKMIIKPSRETVEKFRTKKKGTSFFVSLSYFIISLFLLISASFLFIHKFVPKEQPIRNKIDRILDKVNGIVKKGNKDLILSSREDEITTSELIKKISKSELTDSDFSKIYLNLELKNKPIVDINNRPRPDGLDFKTIKKDLNSYINSQKPDAQEGESNRVSLLKNLRPHLVKILQANPYSGKIFTKNNGTFYGQIPLARVKDLEIKNSSNKSKKRYKWSEMKIEMFVALLKHSMERRSAFYSDDNAEEQNKDIVKDIGLECFYIALLTDWYGIKNDSENYAKLSVKFNPSLKNKVSFFIPTKIIE